MVEPTLSTPRRLPIAVLRGLAIFFGTTLVAHGLARATDGGRLRILGDQDFTTTGISGTSIPSYLEWLGDAIAFESDLIRTLGNTALLAVAGIVIGLALGGLFSVLAKFRPLAKSLGILSSPILAVAVPGVALYPLANWAANSQSLPDAPDRLDPSDLASPWFFLVWAVPIGLAIAPVIGAGLTGPTARRTIGLDVARMAVASRPAPAGTGFGLPTIIVLMVLAAVEVTSGHNGLFGRFYSGLEQDDLTLVLDVVLIVALVGALVTFLLDLVPGVTAGSDEPLPPTRRSEATWPLLASLLVVCTIAAVGYLRDPALSPIADGSAGPTIGGPWLGTDSAGSSLIERTVVALGPTLLAGILPAALASVAGGLFAGLIRRIPHLLGRAFDALIDALWWPAPLVLPLVHLSVGNPERSEFHLGVVGLTGLMLTPLATRLSARTSPASRNGARAAVRVLVFLTAICVSARVLLGFFGLTDGPNGSTNADLGAMISANALADPFQVWPLLMPAIVLIALLSLLYWLAAAITAPVPYRKLVGTDAVTGVGDIALTTDPDRRTSPLQPQDLRTVSRPSASEPAAEGETEVLVTAGLAAEVDPPTTEVEDSDLTEEIVQESTDQLDDQPTEVDIDLTEGDSEDTVAVEATGTEPPGALILDDQELDDQTKAELDMLNSTSIDLAADASRTIRLRPSTLRRAGIVAPGTEPPEKSEGERSILASQAEDYTVTAAPDTPAESTASDEEPGTTQEQDKD